MKTVETQMEEMANEIEEMEDQTKNINASLKANALTKLDKDHDKLCQILHKSHLRREAIRNINLKVSVCSNQFE